MSALALVLARHRHRSPSPLPSPSSVLVITRSRRRHRPVSSTPQHSLSRLVDTLSSLLALATTPRCFRFPGSIYLRVHVNQARGLSRSNTFHLTPGDIIPNSFADAVSALHQRQPPSPRQHRPHSCHMTSTNFALTTPLVSALPTSQDTH